MCNCGCNTCETKKPALMLNESLAPRAILSEGLNHHLDANKPLTDHLYRAGSTAYFNLWAEARSYYSRGIIDISNEDDLSVLTETNLGHYGLLEQTSTVSKRRAGAELKQKLKGVRSDGFGKYDATIYGLDSDGKRVELKSLNDLNKFDKFELAENKKVPLDFPMLDEDIDNDIMLLEEGIMDLIKKGKEVTEEFLVKNIDPIVSKIIAAIKKGGDFVVNLLKKLFNVVEKYRKKYPTLFKVVILLILMVTTMIFSTAAQAADPGDLNYSADALNTMVGLLDKIPTDVDVMDKMEAKVYLKDLQDGNLSGAYGEGAKNIASSIEVVYRDILQSAKDGDQGGMEILLQALETGKNTVMSALGVAINEAKKAKNEQRDIEDEYFIIQSLRTGSPKYVTNIEDEKPLWVPDSRIKQAYKFATLEDAKNYLLKFDSKRTAFWHIYRRPYDLSPKDVGFGRDLKNIDRHELSESKITNKKLNKPMRDSSGGKAYKVYVKDPKTGNIKTVRFGSGGLRAKINDKKARNAFAARHKCSTKKDKTKAGYWSCRLPRYAKLLGLKSNFGGFW